MYRLLNRLGHEGLEPLLQHLESFIKQSGLDDMKACVEIIVTVRTTATVAVAYSPAPF